MITRYSKPLGNLLDFKRDFFDRNIEKVTEFRYIAEAYRNQPVRERCKNCDGSVSFEQGFVKMGVRYSFCPHCGHVNGAHEDTDAFHALMYTEDAGKAYATYYKMDDDRDYWDRVAGVYLPKAEFLRACLSDRGAFPSSLLDYGAGAGYFVAAAESVGFEDVVGYEVSPTLVEYGTRVLDRDWLVRVEPDDMSDLLVGARHRVVSMVAVLEHIRDPRGALWALRDNPDVEYLYLSLPLMSPTVALEAVFPDVMPRHLTAGHTHIYTEQSIAHARDEFGWETVGEWWYGLDATDLYRSVLVSLGDDVLSGWWSDKFLPLVDDLQKVIDRARLCTEVHLVWRKR